MDDKNSSKISIGLIVIIVMAVLILFTVGPFLFRGGASEVTTPTVEAVTDEPAATEENPSSSFEPFESTGAEDASEIDQERLRVGELEIEYPPVMLMRESETIALSVFVPFDAVNASVFEFERIPIVVNQPGIIGFSTFTVLYDSMRARLTSTSFTIEPLQNDEPRFVDLDTPEARTTWNWIIQAPDYPGEQVIAVSIYLGDESQPSWVGSIKINVGSPTLTPHPTASHTPTPTITPSPTPTATPVPVLVRVGNQIIDGISIEVCLGIPALILAIFAVVDQLKKRMKKRKRKTTK